MQEMREFSTELKLFPVHVFLIFIGGNRCTIWSLVFRKQHMNNTGFMRSSFPAAYEMKVFIINSFNYNV